MQNFWQELNARIAKYDLLCHPFYQAWTMGQLTHDDLRAYAADYYHHVAAFPEYLRIFEERLNPAEGGPAVREMAEAVSQNHGDEEGAGSPDGRSHAELWLDFAEGMGANRTMVKEHRPVAEVRELISTFEKIAEEGTPAEALAACTVNAAHVLGRGDSLGRLASGRAADIVLLDAPDWRYLAYHLGGNLVRGVILKGTPAELR